MHVIAGPVLGRASADGVGWASDENGVPVTQAGAQLPTIEGKPARTPRERKVCFRCKSETDALVWSDFFEKVAMAYVVMAYIVMAWSDFFAKAKHLRHN